MMDKNDNADSSLGQGEEILLSICPPNLLGFSVLMHASLASLTESLAVSLI